MSMNEPTMADHQQRPTTLVMITNILESILTLAYSIHH